MVRLGLTACVGAALLLVPGVFPAGARCQESGPQAPNQNQAPPLLAKPQTNPKAPVVPTEREELQKAIDEAANDRAALVRNLEEFLKKYPESSQRAQVYRAIVESSLQLRDFPRAMDYSERMVALKPDDASINILAIQLLERYGDAPGWKRAISYCTRVIDIVDREPIADKSPKISEQEWQNEKKKSLSSLLLIRGRLFKKLNNLPEATKDFEASYAMLPSSLAAEGLGEIAESKKDQNLAILEYARAFALTDGTPGASSRMELRKKVGNVWRLAHGSEDGLGDYLLKTMDDVAAANAPAKTARNNGRKDPYEFVLRKAGDGSAVALADTKGKVVVLNFWATWCGPCRELEPHFEKVAARYAGQKDVLFYALNCDEDESLVAPYLEKEKPKTTVLFADGLDLLYRVNSFPTLMILDRSGKVAFHEDGFDPDTIDKVLSEAVERVEKSGENPQAVSAGPVR